MPRTRVGSNSRPKSASATSFTVSIMWARFSLTWAGSTSASWPPSLRTPSASFPTPLSSSMYWDTLLSA